MNLEQAKKKLTAFRQSVSTQYPNFTELCGLIEFILDELERIKSPPMTSLRRLPDLDPTKPIGPPPPPVIPYISPERRGFLPKRRRCGNAGDAT